MRRLAVINQKGGVGKTTTCANLGAALARSGRRVVLVDMDAQANLTLSLDVEAPQGSPSTYTLLTGETDFGASLRETAIPRMRLLPANIDLSGAELELAAAMGRENLMREAIAEWERDFREKEGRSPAEYVIFDCPPSLGLLSINALSAADEVLIAIQTEFLALQGMSKLVEILHLLKKRLNPRLEIAGILPCLYDSRLKLAREVLAEIRKFFPGQVLPSPIRSNVKLAEAPSFGKTIFEYAPDSNGAQDYLALAQEIHRGESRDPDFSSFATPPEESTPQAAAAPETEREKEGTPTTGARRTEDSPTDAASLATVVLAPPPAPMPSLPPVQSPSAPPSHAFDALENYAREA